MEKAALLAAEGLGAAAAMDAMADEEEQEYAPEGED